MKTVLTIAGSDCSGGAGIQADIKTICTHGLYAMSAITALTAQNTLGVHDVFAVEPHFVSAQMDAVFTDIPPDAVKIGMVSCTPLILAIANALQKYCAKNIVIDPVMVSTSGSALLSPDAVSAFKKHLLPLGQVITPNIPEATVLCGMPINNEEDMATAAKMIYEEIHIPVLIKGGHQINDANDILFDGLALHHFPGRRIPTTNTHGTGCTLSSAIACNLARGLSLPTSIENAKIYISGALSYDLNLGQGPGPMNHMHAIKLPF